MIRPVLAFVAVLTAALNLRAGMASVGAVLDEVIADYGAPASLGGVITALPGLMFCIVGLTAVPLARRVGLSPTLAGAAILSTLGLALRPFAPHIALFILSTVAVAGGIALANVLLPAWIKQYGGAHIVAMTTVYSVSLSLSAAAGPLSALVTDTWQGALALWAVSALVQAVVWLVVWGKVGVDKPSGDEAQAGGGAGIYRSPTAVALMFFFGLQSMTAYIQMGWLPTILGTVGVPAETGALGLSLIGLIGALGGLVLPTVISRARTLTPLVLLFGVLTAAGYAGILLAPAAAPIAWSALLGFGGWCFPLAIALMPARTRTALGTARLAGFVQPIGYILAAIGPLLVGVGYDAAGSFTPILIALIVLALLMGGLGVIGARKVYIEDELAGRS
ncbi:MFS transporter [Corynebacterium auris]|uniref:MFS transporter n=1 Tax=Corynebacterium auris TaxID=44750 RepID=UPI0033905B3E|nr:Inner membrane transport protein YeaN [Corynebacterium auris]